uniref:HDC19381 n=1 Tax=Drosophila melanogaster TaxID=7227 RepID=Q6II93_DROME|nr:TPA_inf: HDC19381 [Drosophila melanogaster]
MGPISIASGLALVLLLARTRAQLKKPTKSGPRAFSVRFKPLNPKPKLHCTWLHIYDSECIPADATTTHFKHHLPPTE